MDLVRALNSVGKTCFVKYYELFASNKPVEDIVEVLLNEEGYAETASRTRVNNARRIMNEGMAKQALEMIVQSHHPSINQSIKNKALTLIKNN